MANCPGCPGFVSISTVRSWAEISELRHFPEWKIEVLSTGNFLQSFCMHYSFTDLPCGLFVADFFIEPFELIQFDSQSLSSFATCLMSLFQNSQSCQPVIPIFQKGVPEYSVYSSVRNDCSSQVSDSSEKIS